VDDLKRLVEPATLGSQVEPLRWVSKSRAKLAKALKDMGHAISADSGDDEQWFRAKPSGYSDRCREVTGRGMRTPLDASADLSVVVRRQVWRSFPGCLRRLSGTALRPARSFFIGSPCVRIPAKARAAVSGLRMDGPSSAKR
jgi:hypothetical protein